MISLGAVDRFVAGAVGGRGNRTFYLEVDAGGDTYRFLVEKQQVEALARRALDLARSLFPERTETTAATVDLSPDLDPLFRVGEIGIAHTDPTFTVVLRSTDEEAGAVDFDVTVEQLESMALAALDVVAAGRPLCPRCSLPMDPDGHVCPASNGDLRPKRP